MKRMVAVILNLGDRGNSWILSMKVKLWILKLMAAFILGGMGGRMVCLFRRDWIGFWLVQECLKCFPNLVIKVPPNIGSDHNILICDFEAKMNIPKKDISNMK